MFDRRSQHPRGLLVNIRYTCIRICTLSVIISMINTFLSLSIFLSLSLSLYLPIYIYVCVHIYIYIYRGSISVRRRGARGGAYGVFNVRGHSCDGFFFGFSCFSGSRVKGPDPFCCSVPVQFVHLCACTCRAALSLRLTAPRRETDRQIRHLRTEAMDASAMKFPDGHFDFTIEKGLFDALCARQRAPVSETLVPPELEISRKDKQQRKQQRQKTQRLKAVPSERYSFSWFSFCLFRALTASLRLRSSRDPHFVLICRDDTPSADQLGPEV